MTMEFVVILVVLRGVWGCLMFTEIVAWVMHIELASKGCKRS